MSTKYKATGCAKFFFVLIILAPLAYLGASYFNGQDGIENVKGIFGSDKIERHESPEDDVFKLKNQLTKFKKDAEFFEKEKIRLEKELEACQNARN